MTVPFTNVTGSATISTTEFSLVTASTTPGASTTACELEAWIDLSAMLAGDQYRIRLVEKVNGGTAARATPDGFPTGLQDPPIYVLSPGRRVGEGWDVRITKITGTDRAIAWSLRQDVGDVSGGALSAGAITSATFAAGAINAAAIASAALTAAKFATDAIDANALAANAVTEIQSGLSTAAALTTAQTDLTTLTGRLTAGRATGLDNLDATVSSRAASATALSTVQWTNARAVLQDNLDAAVSTRAPSSTALSNVQWTNARATLQDNLDATVSTRATATALTTAQGDLTNIKTRIPTALDGSGNIKAAVQSIITDAIDGNALASSAVTKIQAGLATAAAVAAISAAAIATAVWSSISEGTETVIGVLRLLRARELGKATVQDGDGAYTYRDAADTKNRLVMNRTGTVRTTTTADGT